MRLTMTTLAAALLTLPAGSHVRQMSLACHVRGSQQWLATRASPLDSVTVTVEGKTAKICYSRPSARGRSVDSLVPPGLAWRLGANEPTTITLTDGLTIGGTTLGAGRYVILAVPSLNQWTLVFYTTPDTEPAKMFQNLREVGTGTGQVEHRADTVEKFTIRGEGDTTKCELLFEWGTWRVHVPVQLGS